MVVSLSNVPIGAGTELKSLVADVLKVIDESGLPYRLGAMSTEIEGDWDSVMAVVKQAHDAGRRASGRVLTHIAIDDRDGFSGRLDGKRSDVESILGKKLERKG